MREKKYRIRLTEFERGILLNSLMEMRNGLIREGKDTEPVNELILQIINAPYKASLFGSRNEWLTELNR